MSSDRVWPFRASQGTLFSKYLRRKRRLAIPVSSSSKIRREGSLPTCFREVMSSSYCIPPTRHPRPPQHGKVLDLLQDGSGPGKPAMARGGDSLRSCYRTTAITVVSKAGFGKFYLISSDL